MKDHDRLSSLKTEDVWGWGRWTATVMEGCRGLAEGSVE